MLSLRFIWQDGNTALHFAVCRGHTEVVRCLLLFGAKPTLRNSVRYLQAYDFLLFAFAGLRRQNFGKSCYNITTVTTRIPIVKYQWSFLAFFIPLPTPHGARVPPFRLCFSLSIYFLIFCYLLLFLFFLFLFTLLIFSIVHPIPFYQNRPTPFPGVRS